MSPAKEHGSSDSELKEVKLANYRWKIQIFACKTICDLKDDGNTQTNKVKQAISSGSRDESQRYRQEEVRRRAQEKVSNKDAQGNWDWFLVLGSFFFFFFKSNRNVEMKSSMNQVK